jgi:hypothetical protein
MKVSDRQSNVQKSRKRKLSQSKGGADEVKRTQNYPTTSCFGRRNSKKSEHAVPLKKNALPMIKAAPLGSLTIDQPIRPAEPVPDENVATNKTMRLKQSPLYHQYASCEGACRLDRILGKISPLIFNTSPSQWTKTVRYDVVGRSR